MPRTAGHLIVDTLAAHGVERVYVVPGESYLDVLDGLHDASIRTVVCRQEGGAGFMALAEGRLTGRPGIAMVTRGPGAANAMIAVHTAWQDATAMVLLVGLIPFADRGRESFQEFSLEGWFGTTAKRVLSVEQADRAGETIAEAMQVAATGRPGPVVVGLPEDVLVQLTSAPVPAPRPVAAPAVPAAQLDRVVERLGAARAPLVVAGGDGWHGTTGAELARLAEAAGLPVACDWRAYDAVPNDSAAYAGWLGYGRADTLAARLDETDLLMLVGCGRGDVLSEGYTAGMDAPTVLAVPDPAATMHDGRIDELVVATPAAFVEALAGVDAARLRGARDDAWMRALADDQRRFAAPRPDGAERGVDLGVAFAALDELLPADRVCTYGAGNATLWGHRHLEHRAPNSLVGPRNGAMGLGVPAAVAASLVHPQRRVVAVCGDGDFLMNGQELAAAIATGAAPLVVVVDNGRYGTIVLHQQRDYPGRESGTDLVNPDFGAWMRSFGGFGEKVERTEDARGAFERALASGTAAVVHLVVDRETMPAPTDNRPDAGPATTGHAGTGTTETKETR